MASPPRPGASDPPRPSSDPPRPSSDPPGAPTKRHRLRPSVNKDVLLCDICLELYDDGDRQPKFLTCHHSYCRSCLTQVAAGGDSLECPSCRAVSPLSPGGVPALQTNFYISQLQDTLRQAGAERARGCRRHLNQPMAFFCTKCRALVCRDCTVLDHRADDGHTLQDVTDADPDQRDKLKVKVAAATATFEEVQAQLGHLEAESANISAAREETTRDVVAACDGYAKMVAVRKTQLLKQMTDDYNKRQAEIIRNAESIGSKLKKMAKTLTNAERLTRQGPLCDVITTAAWLEQTTGDLKRLLLGMDAGMMGRLRYDARHGEVQYQATVAGLGRFVAENPKPPKLEFTLQSDDKLVAGLKAVVKVQVLDAESGQPCARTFVDVMITDREGDRLNRTVQWDDDSNGTVTFVPQISGELHFQGTFRGRVVQTSKHTMSVSSNDPVGMFGVMGDGKGTFHSPRAVALDSEGFLFIADTGNRVIQKVDSEGKFVCDFEIGTQNSTCDVALTDDLVVCTETVVTDIHRPLSGNTVLLFDINGDLSKKFNNRSMKCGLCVATNSLGEILVSDFLKKCIYMYDHQGNLIRKIGHFNHPAFICITKDDDDIIVTDTKANNLHIYSRDGHLIRKFGRSGNRKGELTQPFGVATDGEYIVIADSGNQRLQVYTVDGALVSVIESLGSPLNQPRGIALSDDGHVFVADRDNHCIKKYRYK